MSFRVLVVDDDPHVLGSLAQTVKAWGYEPEPLPDPRLAAERIAAQAYDVVLAGHSMPILIGLDVLRAAFEQEPACPVILLTASEGSPPLGPLRIGALHFLTKALENDQLRPLLEGAIADRSRGALGEENKTEDLRRLLADVAGTSRSGTTRGAGAVPAARPGNGPDLELPQAGIDLRGVLASYEERLIRQALERSGGNKNRAAALLGLNRTTLVEKLKRIPSLRAEHADPSAPASDEHPGLDSANPSKRA